MALNAKQSRFCVEYIVDLNATQAAIRSGYSKKTAGAIGAENLKKPQIQKRISELNVKRIEKTKIDPEYILKRCQEIDALDVTDIINDTNTGFKPISEWPKAWRTSIRGIDLMEVMSGDDMKAIVKKIKWPDKTKNLELMGKHIYVGAFRDKLQVSGDDDNPITIITRRIVKDA